MRNSELPTGVRYLVAQGFPILSERMGDVSEQARLGDDLRKEMEVLLTIARRRDSNRNAAYPTTTNADLVIEIAEYTASKFGLEPNDELTNRVLAARETQSRTAMKRIADAKKPHHFHLRELLNLNAYGNR